MIVKFRYSKGQDRAGSVTLRKEVRDCNSLHKLAPEVGVHSPFQLFSEIVFLSKPSHVSLTFVPQTQSIHVITLFLNNSHSGGFRTQARYPTSWREKLSHEQLKLFPKGQPVQSCHRECPLLYITQRSIT